MALAQHTGSYYAATANAAPERPALKGQISCDVCVIGAGFTGLSTALHLAEKGHKVAVVNAEVNFPTLGEVIFPTRRGSGDRPGLDQRVSFRGLPRCRFGD